MIQKSTHSRSRQVLEINEPPDILLTSYMVTVREYHECDYEIQTHSRKDLLRQLNVRIEDGLPDDVRVGETEITGVRVHKVERIDAIPVPNKDVKCRKLPVIQA